MNRSSQNSLIIEGNIAETPELTEGENGNAICRFSIRSIREPKSFEKEKENEVSIFEVEINSKPAEKLSLLKKDDYVRVVGRLKQKWWHEEEGKYLSKIIIIGEHIESIVTSSITKG